MILAGRPTIKFDLSLLDAFKTAETRSEALDSGGRCVRTVNISKGTNIYRLRDRHAVPSRGDVLSAHARGVEGDLSPRYTFDHFGTEVEVLDVGRACYCLLAPLSGSLEHAGPSGKTEAHGTKGMILRSLPGNRLVTSDASLRLVVWMDAARLERLLQARVGEPPRDRLAFAPGLDWDGSRERVVWRMVVRLFEELRDPEGLLSEPVARETFTDLFLQTVLTRQRGGPPSFATGRGVHARSRRPADHHGRCRRRRRLRDSDAVCRVPSVPRHDAARRAAPHPATAGARSLADSRRRGLDPEHRAALRLHQSVPFHRGLWQAIRRVSERDKAAREWRAAASE
jgi:hypothetical protein